ncbi:hypothetical protein GCM10009069_09350 [Algimonas arctica]|uniref:Outer membrane protein beta-barrel domain-containing protein n=1 Tax=Algimonas arctica TaxID=1479486 RepID=A0A8J3CNI0_9PROT|nr:hypothetical protein [Algimonas arctica]GHA88528.1 hypothetical protein GCM10009069_09350 [Algimonas arctica]
MNNRLLVTAIGAAAMAVSGCAYQGASYGHTAQPTYNPYGASAVPYRRHQQTVGGTRIETELSYEQFVDGNIIDGGTVIGGDTTADVGYQDAFKPGYRASIGIARDFRPNTTVMAKGFYSQAEGEDDVVIATNGGGNVLADFSDYTSYGAELGLRQYLSPAQTRLRPFVGATVGAAFVEDLSVSTGGPSTVINDAGWTATASATGGFEMPLSPTASLALESGIRWSDAQDRSAFGATLGDDNSRLSVPVTLRGRFRF